MSINKISRIIAKDVARISSDSILPGTGKYVEAAVDRITKNTFETAKSTSPSELIASDLIILKTNEDFRKSCISSVNNFTLACDSYKFRLDAITKYKDKGINTDNDLNYSEAEDLKETYNREWVKKKIHEITIRISKHSRERAFSASEGKQVSFLPPDTGPLVEKLQTFCNTENRKLRVSCESIEPATVATCLYMRNVLDIPIDVIYDSSSGVYQTISVAEDEDNIPYDFVVTACGAYTLTGRIKLKLTSFQLAFPIHTEEQVILCRPKLITKLGERFGRSISFQDIKELHIFKYSSSHEELIMKGQKIDKNKTVITTHDHFEKLTTLFETMDPGVAVNAWSPLSQVLEGAAWAKTIGDSPYENLIGMYLREDWQNPSMAPVSEAFLELFLVSWNYLNNHSFLAFELLFELDNLSSSFKEGAGLIVPDHLLRNSN